MDDHENRLEIKRELERLIGLCQLLEEFADHHQLKCPVATNLMTILPEGIELLVGPSSDPTPLTDAAKGNVLRILDDAETTLNSERQRLVDMVHVFVRRK